jgi:hypothetical protein
VSDRKRNVAFALAVMLCLVQVSEVSGAQPKAEQGGATLIVRSDPGGDVRARRDELVRIFRLGQRVEIRGTCLSSCTMYLVLKDRVCVSPQARFGFHGPSRYGLPLSAQEFEDWSHAIAAYYPHMLRSWYLSTARHDIYRLRWVSGAELIRLGVRRCP